MSEYPPFEKCTINTDENIIYCSGYDVKPCKDCGSTNVEIESVELGLPWGAPVETVFHGKCYNCGLTGADFSTIDDAIEAWNRRADDGKMENCR